MQILRAFSCGGGQRKAPPYRHRLGHAPYVAASGSQLKVPAIYVGHDSPLGIVEVVRHAGSLPNSLRHRCAAGKCDHTKALCCVRQSAFCVGFREAAQRSANGETSPK